MTSLRAVRRRLRRLAGDPAGGLLLARAGAAIALVHLDLRLGGLPRALNSPTGGAAARPTRSRVVDEGALGRAERYARSIEAAARYHPVRARCLHRALVLHRWLRREGLPSELRIGVRKLGGALNAHAWVEVGGAVVGDHPAALAQFTPLADLVQACTARGVGGLRWS
jgi:hypothetical protein